MHASQTHNTAPPKGRDEHFTSPQLSTTGLYTASMQTQHISYFMDTVFCQKYISCPKMLFGIEMNVWKSEVISFLCSLPFLVRIFICIEVFIYPCEGKKPSSQGCATEIKWIITSNPGNKPNMRELFVLARSLLHCCRNLNTSLRLNLK